MNSQDLIKKIAQLESLNDQLIAELECLDHLTKKLGFTEGLITLKSAAQELLKEQRLSEDGEEPPLTG